MKKSSLLLGLMMITPIMLTACKANGKVIQNDDNIIEESTIETEEVQLSKKELSAEFNSSADLKEEKSENVVTEEESINEQESEFETETSNSVEIIDNLDFEILSNYMYEFSSGAGGWSTSLYIEKDGSFHGLFSDSDMGVTGDEYPNGTLYVSDYSGHFDNLIKIDEYTYEMDLADISYKNTLGKEEIINGTLYVYMDAYGLSGTKKFRVYLPGKPISELSEEVCTWIVDRNEDSDKLKSISLENVEQEEGFYSQKRLSPYEEAKMNYNLYKETYEYYNELISDESNTAKLVELNFQCYSEMDRCLNDIWRIVRYSIDEDKYNKILEEQRAWIVERDKKAQEDMDSWGGGTFEKVVYWDTMAKMTIDRCGELVEYLK